MITKNTFYKGLNTDSDKNTISSDSYIDAHNVELVSDGAYYALKNIRGTTNVCDITDSTDSDVLGVFETKYKIDGVYSKCLTIFVVNPLTFTIYAYDVENNVLYSLFQETTPNDYITDNRIVHVESYAENGIDILYINDFYNEVRQLRCEITGYAPNFLTNFDLSLQRRGANGVIEFQSVTTGGTLLSGTYQITYRMADPPTKKYTKWSTLTNPIHVYIHDTSDKKAYAGIGLPTSNKITLNIIPTDDELANFNYFQLAVVENVYPTGAQTITNGDNQSFVASLLDIEPINNRTGFEYKSNTKVGTIPIDDITVDLAPIKSAKTLTINQNKLLIGNIKYHKLELDNGTPSATGGIQTVVDGQSTLYWQSDNSTRYKGYFRGETYRFGIVYYDKYGNSTPVSVLDMSNITDNQISGVLPDMKFPERSFSNTYSILDSIDNTRALGLDLVIENHPSWAVGFEIVRAKRIKRVMFQTPVIPMMVVEGIGASGQYPTQVTITDEDEDKVDYPDAQPMTSSKVYITKNLFWPERRYIGKRKANTINGGSTVGTFRNIRKRGESKMRFDRYYNYAAIFPQTDLYEKSSFVPYGNEKLETVDYCLMRLNVENFDQKTKNNANKVYDGNYQNTKISGNFYSLRNGDYYYDATTSYSGKSVDPINPITDYVYIPQGSDGTTLSGEKILTFDDLQTKGIGGFDFKPTNQAIAVIKLKNNFEDEGSAARTFSNGNHLAYGSGGGRIISGSGPYYQVEGTENNGSAVDGYSNKFINQYDYLSSFSEDSSYVQSIRIANVVRNEVGDDRYGDLNTQHEFISTGAKYTFTPTEIATLQGGGDISVPIDVWGGDCFVSYHLFKVSDSTYVTMNQTKNNNDTEPIDTTLDAWNDKWYGVGVQDVNPNPTKMLPIALEKVAQFVQVFIESEYNGEAVDYDVYKKVSSVSGTPILNVTEDSNLKTPLTYNYNINVSKQNDQKIYFTKPDYFIQQDEFPARVLVSDQKIYNSDQSGFDIFRVLNLLDLQENFGGIFKLANAGDASYAIQEKGIVWLPVGETQLEQTDSGILSVGTGSTIGRPRIIDSKRGSQHSAGVLGTGGTIYIPDNRNKSVYTLSGQELVSITVNNDTLFRSFFGQNTAEKNILGIYDPIKKQYLLADNYNHKCYVFNEYGVWSHNIEFDSDATLVGGVHSGDNLYLIGKVGDQLSIYEMYTGEYCDLFGKTVIPRVSFVANPSQDFSKTFDAQMFAATERLDTVDWEVEREQLLGSQIVNGTIIDELSVEGNYRAKTMRDADKARLRGLRLLTTVKWKTGNTPSILSSVYTKYRLSSRTEF